MIIVELTLITAALLWFAVALELSAAEADTALTEGAGVCKEAAPEADHLRLFPPPSVSAARLNGAIYNWANDPQLYIRLAWDETG